MARKLHPWRPRDIQECCPDLRLRLDKTELRLFHNRVQHFAPLHDILRKPEPLRGTRACCLLAMAHRCTDFEVLCRKLLQFCVSLEQHRRQKLAWQQREGTPE